MSSQNVQKHSATPKSPPTGEENEATALPSSLIDNQEYFSFPRQSLEQMAGGGQQSPQPPSLQQTLQQQVGYLDLVRPVARL